jgi:hypothetical protein
VISAILRSHQFKRDWFGPAGQDERWEIADKQPFIGRDSRRQQHSEEDQGADERQRVAPQHVLAGLVAGLVISMLDMPIFAFRRKRLDWGCAGPIIPRDWRAPLDPIAIGVPQWPAIADRIPGGHRVDCGHGNSSGNCRCRASELAPSRSLAACQSVDIGGGQGFTADPPITAFHLLD